MATWTMIGSKINGESYRVKNKDYLVFSFDSINSIETNWNSSVSKYGIEDMEEISNHVQNHNEQYTMVGAVSNSPIEKFESNVIGYDNLGSPIASKNLNTRTKQAVETLRLIKDSRQPITLVNEYSVLKEVVITGVQFAQTPENSDLLLFNISFEKVRRISVGTTYVSVAAPQQKKTAKKQAGTANSKTERKSAYVAAIQKTRAEAIKK